MFKNFAAFAAVVGLMVVGVAFWAIPIYFLLIAFGVQIAFWKAMTIAFVLMLFCR